MSSLAPSQSRGPRFHVRLLDNLAPSEEELSTGQRELERLAASGNPTIGAGLIGALGVTAPGVKAPSVSSVESMIEIVRANAHNMKRWKDGDMRLRRAATGMLAAEQ